MRASGYAREDRDFYQEPRWAVDALLDAELFQGTTWDPACGGGNIPEACMKRGLFCVGSDICDRGYGRVLDFLGPHESSVANIISNPPYGVIEQFIDRALGIATHKVAILARLALLEGKRRSKWFRQVPLARVWVSSRRISMPPGGTDVPAKGGSVAYAWFVFEHEHGGSPTIGWIA